MKIGLVLPSTPGYSETFFTSKIKGLQEHGFSVVLLTQTIGKNFDLCPVVKAPKIYKSTALQMIAMIFVFLKLLWHLKPVINYIKLERQENISTSRIIKKVYFNSHLLSQKLDWLHFGFTTQALESELVAKAIRAKMAVSFRGFDINVYPVKHPNCYDLVWKHVNKVHSISIDLLQKAYGLGLANDSSYKVITPAVDVSNFNARKDFKSENSKLKIITIARLNWIKGLDHALNAMKLLNDKGLEFEYHIIGSGTPTEIERYTFQLHQNQLQNHVFLHGKLSHEETLLKLCSADIYLQPSIQEGFCNAVLEAQAMGLLCLATNGGALNENIIHEKTGWIVPKRAPRLIAEKILEINELSDNEKKSISKNAINHVMANFNVKEQQKQFVDFYNNEIRL
ncbi:glycosyltransferase family 4 protein [Psychroserpens ponticola]|uniref:Glycosyltransferase family 4 protein n=1 Tax=Psychroserpens ponticola TaxID=2932268 RepID=A0ABY7RZG0_9FLAO|nr:glycosyltransferase family 4 protein [Psychroserpens ponticola]WCO02534.1 glycosyltransferase family 4 protein [Psychroserpens ponticola]